MIAWKKKTEEAGGLTRKPDRRPLSWQKRVLCMGTGVALLAAAVWGMYRVLPEQTVLQEETLYSYEVSADTAYRVALIPNNLFSERWLPEGQVYAGALTDYIEVTQSAIYQGSEAAALDGAGQVTAVLRATQTGADGTERLIYERQELLGEGTLERSGGSATLAATVNIRPEEYRQAVVQASETLGANPSFQFFLRFEGSFLADTAYGAVEAPFACQISIPVGRDSALYEVTELAGEVVADSLTRTVETVAPGAGAQIVIPLVAAALLGLALLAFGGLLTRSLGTEERYLVQLGKITRKYGDRMVRLDRLPEAGEGHTVRVTDINSLVLLAEELRQPILCDSGEEEAAARRFCVWDGQTAFLLELEPPSTTFVVEEDGPSDP